MLGHAKLESLRDIDSCAPGVLNADRIRRPGVERLGDRLAEQESRCAPYLEAPQRSTAKWTDLEYSRQHVTRKQAARSIDAAILPGIAGALVRIHFVVRRRQ